MRSNFKKMMRSLAAAVSLLNVLWAFQLQAGSAEKDWAPILSAGLSVWACYFAITWIIGGLRSER
jgi:hypothetical protein